jgi:aspartokinase-like uncharacterized kinase
MGPPLVSPVVIKVGGSLLDWDELPGRLSGFLDADLEGEPPLRGRCVLIAGGGGAAELVRSMDRIHGLGELRSHELAIQAMDLTAAILSALLPDSRVASSREEVVEARRGGRIPVLAPRGFLGTEAGGGTLPPLPPSWDVTSDSIAAWIGRAVGADRLILLKSAPIVGIATISGAARSGLVDPFFPIAATGLGRVGVVCLRASAYAIRTLRS